MVHTLKEKINEAYYKKYAHINRDLLSRLISQIHYDNFSEIDPMIPDHINIISFTGWDRTKEGPDFWGDMHSLDHRCNLQESEVQRVYEKYKIPYVPNTNIHEVWMI